MAASTNVRLMDVCCQSCPGERKVAGLIRFILSRCGHGWSRHGQQALSSLREGADP
jgi:hypothetical protein